MLYSNVAGKRIYSRTPLFRPRIKSFFLVRMMVASEGFYCNKKPTQHDKLLYKSNWRVRELN